MRETESRKADAVLDAGTFFVLGTVQGLFARLCSKHTDSLIWYHLLDFGLLPLGEERSEELEGAFQCVLAKTEQKVA